MGVELYGDDQELFFDDYEYYRTSDDDGDGFYIPDFYTFSGNTTMYHLNIVETLVHVIEDGMLFIRLPRGDQRIMMEFTTEFTTRILYVMESDISECSDDVCMY